LFKCKCGCAGTLGKTHALYRLDMYIVYVQLIDTTTIIVYI